MPSSSHSWCVAWPTAQAEHHSAIRSKRASRSDSVSILESRTLFTRRSLGRTAAPMVSGPAQDPRPTSSMPTTISWPSSQNARSIERPGADRFSALRSCGAVLVVIAVRTYARLEGVSHDHHYATSLIWAGTTGSGYDAYDRTHAVTAPPAAAALDLSGDPTFRGDPARLNPEQLLVAA